MKNGYYSEAVALAMSNETEFIFVTFSTSLHYLIISGKRGFIS
jgi:hypothetical protein